MTKKSTKRALISSLLVLAMCFTMLAGTTFAWFTDTATGGSSKIVSGKLDIALFMADAQGTYNEITANSDPIFGKTGSLVAQNNPQDTLWEPGKTQIAFLQVKNLGNLWAKYRILVETTDGGLIGSLEYAIIDGAKASDYPAATLATLDWDAIKGNVTGDLAAGLVVAADQGSLEPNGAGDYFALAIHMKETAGNEYQEKDVTIDITVVATQDDVEYDAFNNTYDSAAELPITVVQPTDANELAAAIAAYEPGDIISLDPAVDYGTVNVSSDVVIEANGSAPKLNITGSPNVTIKNADSKNVKATNFSGTLEFDGGKLSTTAAGSSSNADAPFYYQSSQGNGGTFIFNDMTVTAGATKGIKISKAKEVVIDGCVFDAGNMNPTATDTHGAGQTQYDQRSMSMIDIQEQNTDAPMKVTIKNCTFVGAPQGALVGDYADTDTAGAIKLKAESQGFESVTIENNTFTNCYRDVAVGVNVLISNGAWVGIKNPNGLKDAMNNVADTSVWHISGNTTNADAAVVATRGFLIASNGTKAFSDTVGEIIEGAAVYYTYKTAKIAAGMTIAQVNEAIDTYAA